MQYRYKWMEPPTEPLPATETLEADIVILGAGHAGTAVARAAAEGGKSVLVAERQTEEKHMIFGNEVGTINSAFAVSKGAPVYDPLDFLTDWQLRTQNRSDPRLIRRFAQESGRALDWFLQPLDREFVDTITVFMCPPPPHYTPQINGLSNFIGTALFYGRGCPLSAAVRASQDRAKALGARFLYGCAGERLEKEEGRVTALLAKREDGSVVRLRAREAVVLAAGGCTANNEMVHDLYQELDELFGSDTNLRGMGVDDGSGIRMGVWAGGRVQPGPRAAMAPSVSFMAGQFSGTAFLRLNRDGLRYTNEGFMGAFGGGLQAARQPAGFLTAVFDSNWREELNWQAPDHTNIDTNWTALMDRLEADMKNVEAHGIQGAPIHGTTNMQDEGKEPRGEPILCAGTLEELGTALGYSGKSLDNFLRSIARYNELCDLGVDTDFGKDPRQLHPIRKAPFFGVRKALPIPMGPMATLSGLVIDSSGRVLDTEGTPIPGLYAAGNNSGCRFAIQYSTPVAGVSIGMALTLGMLLGEDLSKG